MVDARISNLTAKGTPVGADELVIVDNACVCAPVSKKITISSLPSCFVNIICDATPQLGGDLDACGNNITELGYINWNKIATPGDPAAEEGRMYMREIDTNNNGIFVKIQKAGTITEVQIA